MEAAAQTPREEFNDYNFWHVAPPVIVDSEDNEPPDAGACPCQLQGLSMWRIMPASEVVRLAMGVISSVS